jgi:hypothetical protein
VYCLGAFIALLSIVPSLISCSRQPTVKSPAHIEELRLPSDFAECLMADLDGDSIIELIAFSVVDTGSRNDSNYRKLSIFRFTQTGYNPDPSVTFDIPLDAILFDTGDIDGDSLPELLYLATDGLYAIGYKNNTISQPHQIVAQKSIFTVPTVRSISSWDLYRQMGDQAYLLIPCFEGIAVYSFNRGRIDSLSTLHFSHQARASVGPLSELRDTNPLTYTCRLPAVHIGDYNADLVSDLFIISDNRVLIFPGRLEGRFENAPEFAFGDQYARAVNTTDPNSSLLYQIEDINNDGREDIVVSKNSGGVTSNKTEISVHLCRMRDGYDVAPNYLRSVPKAVGVAYLHDFNSDGRIDMAVPALELGVVALIKMLVLNSLNIDIDIFLQEVGAFPPRPQPDQNRVIRN